MKSARRENHEGARLKHHPERQRVLLAFDGLFFAIAGVIALSGADLQTDAAHRGDCNTA